MQKQKKYLEKIFSLFSVGFFLMITSVQTAFGQWNKSTYDQTGLPKTALGTIISNIALWLLGVFGFLAVIGFVISGVIYFISAGDETAQERAKNAMIYSITGVLVGLAGLVVIYAIDFFLGGSAGSGNVMNSAANSPAAGSVSR